MGQMQTKISSKSKDEYAMNFITAYRKQHPEA